MSVDTVIVAVIGINAAVLVWCHDYEDGLVGRLALGAIFLGAFIMSLVEALDHAEYEIPMEIFIILVGVMVFMLRHTYNWWKYTCRKGKRSA